MNNLRYVSKASLLDAPRLNACACPFSSQGVGYQGILLYLPSLLSR
jgi:hypothetical protein